MIKILNCIAFSFLILLTSSCKDGACNSVLNGVVNETLSLQKSLELSLPQNWIYNDGGGCGLIVYNNGNSVVAYDRCSTMNQSSNSKVTVDGLQIIDSMTGAKWLLMDGFTVAFGRMFATTLSST